MSLFKSVLLFLLFLLVSALLGCGESVIEVSDPRFGAFEPSLAVTSDNRVIVGWNENRHGRDEIRLRYWQYGNGRFEPLDESQALNDNRAVWSYESHVEAFDGGAAVAWYDRDDAGHLVVQLGVWNYNGQPRWQRTLSDATPGVNLTDPFNSTDHPNTLTNERVPDISVVGEQLFITWVEDAREPGEPDEPNDYPVDTKFRPVIKTPSISAYHNVSISSLFNNLVSAVKSWALYIIDVAAISRSAGSPPMSAAKFTDSSAISGEI